MSLVLMKTWVVPTEKIIITRYVNSVICEHVG